MTRDVMVASAIAVGALMLVTWLISVLIHDASLVDIAWGLGFVAVAGTCFAVGDGSHLRRLLILVVVGVWGLRLSAYLAWRKLGDGEDFRYAAMRRRWGDQFAIVSLVRVYLFQGILLWVVSLPVQLSASSLRSTRGPLGYAGLAVAAVGFGFEALADFQLARFKDDSANAGLVMDRGLWRYTRHPNYFGDFLMWWGVYLVAAETEFGRWAFAGPLLLTILLIRVSGVVVLERTIADRRPDYTDYKARTSPFIPWPPKKPGHQPA